MTDLRHFRIQMSGVYRESKRPTGYRANRTISVACPDIITAILVAHREFKKTHDEIQVIAASHSGVVNLVSEKTEWILK